MSVLFLSDVFSCCRNFTASNNVLTTLPGSVKNWRLHVLDLTANNFETHEPNAPGTASTTLPVLTLKEQASRRVLQLKFWYSAATLPATVVSYLDAAKYCVCGSACFEVFLRQPNRLRLGSVAETYSLLDSGHFVPIDCFFCSRRCYNATHRRFSLGVMLR